MSKTADRMANSVDPAGIFFVSSGAEFGPIPKLKIFFFFLEFHSVTTYTQATW